VYRVAPPFSAPVGSGVGEIPVLERLVVDIQEGRGSDEFELVVQIDVPHRSVHAADRRHRRIVAARIRADAPRDARVLTGDPAVVGADRKPFILQQAGQENGLVRRGIELPVFEYDGWDAKEVAELLDYGAVDCRIGMSAATYSVPAASTCFMKSGRFWGGGDTPTLPWNKASAASVGKRPTGFPAAP
jgi:hypothetical protein